MKDQQQPSPSLSTVMKTLKDLEARLDNIESNSLGSREILYKIPGDTEYTRLADSLDKMWTNIDNINNKVDQIIQDAD